MTELPQSIKIGGFNWVVELSKDVSNQGSVYGSTHHSSQKFFIEPGLTEQKQSQTLIHEILHAIWWQSGLGKIYDSKETKDVEETVVHALSMGLHQVMKDNNLQL